MQALQVWNDDIFEILASAHVTRRAPMPDVDRVLELRTVLGYRLRRGGTMADPGKRRSAAHAEHLLHLGVNVVPVFLILDITVQDADSSNATTRTSAIHSRASQPLSGPPHLMQQYMPYRSSVVESFGQDTGTARSKVRGAHPAPLYAEIVKSVRLGRPFESM